MKSSVRVLFFEKQSKMQLLNSNIPRSAWNTKYSNKKAQDLVGLVLFCFVAFSYYKDGSSGRIWTYDTHEAASIALARFTKNDSPSHFYGTKCRRKSQLNSGYWSNAINEVIVRYTFFLTEWNNPGYIMYPGLFGSSGRIWTYDTSVNSRVLLPLSYWGIKNVATSYSPGPCPDKYHRLCRS